METIFADLYVLLLVKVLILKNIQSVSRIWITEMRRFFLS